MIMSLQQQQKDAAANNLEQNQQRPPRSSRAIKTSQGTRSRHISKPLLTPTMAEQQQQRQQKQQNNKVGQNQQHGGKDVVDVLAYSDPQNTVDKYRTANAIATTSTSLRPFQQQQRSFNGLLMNDFTRKTAFAVPRRISQHKTRKNSGQVTLFSQSAARGANLHNSSYEKRPSSKQKKSRHNSGRRPSSRSRSRSSQKSTHNRSSNAGAAADSDCETPSRSSKLKGFGTASSSGEQQRKSLNFGKRARDQNAISAENMRFVAKLINVKATVPCGLDIYRRDAHQKQLRKNLQASSLHSATDTSSLRMIQKINSSQMRRSLQGTPTSTRSNERSKHRGSPQVATDSRLKSKGLQNFYKIKNQNSESKAASPDKSCGTPKHLKPRAFDARNLAQMYEADDHLLFGDKFKQKTAKQLNHNKKCSDTASHASSRSSQGSVRRRKKKAKRRLTAMTGETGSDAGYRQIGSNGGFDEPIEEENSGAAANAIGPRSNQAGQSLIQKMNDLMTQKQKRSKGGQSKSGSKQLYQGINTTVAASSNLAEQVQQMLVTDQENYGRDDLQSLQMKNVAISEQPENDGEQIIAGVNSKQQQQPAAQHKKSFVMKLSRSNPPRHHSKRKSLQDGSGGASHNNASLHPFPQNNHIITMSGSQKAALLSGYYSSQANQMRASSKPSIVNNKRLRQAAHNGGSLPPRNVKTATIRKTTVGHTDIQQTYSSYDYILQTNGYNNSSKASPNRGVAGASMSMQHPAYPRTANNASTASGAAMSAARRRIIVAQNRSLPDDQELGGADGGTSNYTVLPKARNTDSGWNRCQRAANLTTVENNNFNMPQNAVSKEINSGGMTFGRPMRPGAPQSAHPTTTNVSRQKVAQMNQQQPLRAYQQHQDMRKKFLAEKLFSPVLNSNKQSQASSSQAASMPFDSNTIGVESVGEGPPIVIGSADPATGAESSSSVNKDHPPVIIQGGMRPARVTRTADGATRPRPQQQTSDYYSAAPDSIYENNQFSSAGNNQQNSSNLLPKILSTSQQVGNGVTVPIQKLLDSNSSLEDASSLKKTRVAAVNAMATPTQLNVESAETFNYITSAHNIQEEQQPPQLETQVDVQKKVTKTQHKSAAMLFAAPKTFNQISEEGGDTSSENESATKKVKKDVVENVDAQKLIMDEDNMEEEEQLLQNVNAAVLPKNYPRLI